MAAGSTGVTIEGGDGASGSPTLHLTQMLSLEPQASVPAGNMGDIYCNSEGNLYFHNGEGWRLVMLQ